MDRTKLRQIVTQYFSAGELRTLCFDLGVDYDDLPGAGKTNKARELISYLQRRDRLPELVEMIRQLRPNAPWREEQGGIRGASSSTRGVPSERTRAEVESLHRQLAEAKENLRLIEERKAQYVMNVDIPLQLLKEEQAQRKKVTDLQAKVTSSRPTHPGQGPGGPTATGATGNSVRAQLDMAEKVLAVYEEQAAGYTRLTIPAHLAVNLEEQREKVARLREQLAALEG